MRQPSPVSTSIICGTRAEQTIRQRWCRWVVRSSGRGILKPQLKHRWCAQWSSWRGPDRAPRHSPLWVERCTQLRDAQTVSWGPACTTQQGFGESKRERGGAHDVVGTGEGDLWRLRRVQQLWRCHRLLAEAVAPMWRSITWRPWRLLRESWRHWQMQRRLLAKEKALCRARSACLFRISAIMMHGAGTGEDFFAKVKDFGHRPRSCRRRLRLRRAKRRSWRHWQMQRRRLAK